MTKRRAAEFWRFAICAVVFAVLANFAAESLIRLTAAVVAVCCLVPAYARHKELRGRNA